MRYTTLTALIFLFLSCGEGAPMKEKTTSQTTTPTLPMKESVDSALAGSWVLAGLPQSTAPFDQLYPRQRPIIFIQPDVRLISGSTGCNRFSATLSTLGNKLRFTDFTRSSLTCPSEAEPNFLTAWENAKIFRFRNADEMIWGTDSVAWLVFKRR